MPARGCKEVRNRGFRDTGGGGRAAQFTLDI